MTFIFFAVILVFLVTTFMMIKHIIKSKKSGKKISMPALIMYIVSIPFMLLLLFIVFMLSLQF